MELLASGVFGKIYLLNNGDVLKRVERGNDAMQEIIALNAIHHENVIELLRWSYSIPNHIDLIFDYYETDMFKVVYSSEKYNKINICSQILSGLNAIHEAKYMHRDLKLNNILLNRQCEHVVICDFGWSTTYFHGRENTLPESFGFLHPPEMIVGDPLYTEKVDIYAFGMIMFELFNREHVFDPFSDLLTHNSKINQLYEWLLRMRVKTIAKRYRLWSMNDEYFNVWKKCIDQDPSIRPPACVLESFFKDRNF